MTPEDSQKNFYLVMRHFIIDAQKIPGGGKNFPPPDLSSANIALFFLACREIKSTFSFSLFSDPGILRYLRS